MAAHPAPHEGNHRTVGVHATSGPSVQDNTASTQASSAATSAASAATSAASVTPRTVVVAPISATPQLPAPVGGLRLASADATSMTLSWRASADGVSYRVLLNGVAVTRVATASATVAWPDATSRVLVQVAAINARGVASELRSLILVRTVAATPAPATSQAPTSSASSTPTAPASVPPPTASAASANTGPTADTVDDAGNQLAGVGPHA